MPSHLLSLFAPITLLVIAGALVIDRAETTLLQSLSKTAGLERVNSAATATENKIDAVARDLLYLSRGHALAEVLAQKTPDRLIDLSNDWIAFSRAKRIYDQIRWLDETGMERMRIDFRPGAPFAVPPYALQNKGKRYFFTDAISLNPGELFISPLDLNIEGHQIEVPWKPMIRVGTPITDAKGGKRGVVLLNYYGQDMLDRIRQIGGPELMVINADGYWLQAPSSDDEWGFMFKKPELRLAHRYPQAWKQITQSDAGQFETAEGLWSFRAVRPLQQGQRSSTGSHEAFSPSRAEADSHQYVWYLVHLLPRDAYYGAIHDFRQKLAAISSLILLLVFWASWQLARSRQHILETRAQLALANRDLETRVEERTRELEEEITERRAAEASSRHAAEQYHSILEATCDGFWLVDHAGRLLDVNDAYCDIVGYSRDQIVGRTIADFEAHQNPEEIKRNIQRIIHSGHARFEAQHRTASGSNVDLEVSVSLIADSQHMAAFLRNITDRKRSDDQLRQMARIVEATDNAVMVTDRAGIITYVNPAFTAITGYRNSEALGQTPRLLRSGRHEPAFYAEMWQQISVHGVWQGEVWNRRKNGELYAEWLTISDIRAEDGTPLHYVALFSDFTRVKQSAQRLEYLAHHDGLTDLPNRMLLLARLNHAILRAQRERKQLALMFIDLDHFKSVNDKMGHAAGDRVLQDAARRMTRVCRAGDTLARLGGDEFVILLEGIDDVEDVTRVGDALLAQYPIRVSTPDGEIAVTASVGLAYYPADGNTADALLSCADTAMYLAKNRGRGQIARSEEQR